MASTRAAQARQEWLENLGQFVHQDLEQFAFTIMTRSRQVTIASRLRDPEFVARVNATFTARPGHDGDPATPPMFQPFRLEQLELTNRVVVSPMDMYRAVDGAPNDFHLVHLGGKALGGGRPGDD